MNDGKDFVSNTSLIGNGSLVGKERNVSLRQDQFFLPEMLVR